MAEISIGDNHKGYLLRAQYIVEWLDSERAHIEAELAYVTRQRQQAEAQIAAFLAQNYALDMRQAPIRLDVERGVIVTPDPPAPPPPPPPVTAESDG